MRVTFPAHFILDLIALKYFVKRARYEAPHYAVFLGLQPLRSRYYPQHRQSITQNA